MPVRAPVGVRTGPQPDGGYVSPSGLMYSPEEWGQMHGNTGNRSVYFTSSGDSIIRGNPIIEPQPQPVSRPVQQQAVQQPQMVSMGNGLYAFNPKSVTTTIQPIEPVAPGYTRTFDPVNQQYVDYKFNDLKVPDYDPAGAPLYNALIGVSDKLNKYVPEVPVGSNPVIRYPAAFGIGMAEFFTNLPGSLGGAGATIEYAVREPKLFSTQVKPAAKEGIDAIVTAATSDPVRFAGTIAGGLVLGKVGGKIASRGGPAVRDFALDTRYAVKNRYFPTKVTTTGIIEPEIIDITGKSVNLGRSKPTVVKPVALLPESNIIPKAGDIIRVTPEYVVGKSGGNTFKFPSMRDVVPVYEKQGGGYTFRGITSSSGELHELSIVYEKVNTPGKTVIKSLDITEFNKMVNSGKYLPERGTYSKAGLAGIGDRSLIPKGSYKSGYVVNDAPATTTTIWRKFTTDWQLPQEPQHIKTVVLSDNGIPGGTREWVIHGKPPKTIRIKDHTVRSRRARANELFGDVVEGQDAIILEDSRLPSPEPTVLSTSKTVDAALSKWPDKNTWFVSSRRPAALASKLTGDVYITDAYKELVSSRPVVPAISRAGGGEMVKWGEPEFGMRGEQPGARLRRRVVFDEESTTGPMSINRPDTTVKLTPSFSMLPAVGSILGFTQAGSIKNDTASRIKEDTRTALGVVPAVDQFTGLWSDQITNQRVDQRIAQDVVQSSLTQQITSQIVTPKIPVTSTPYIPLPLPLWLGDVPGYSRSNKRRRTGVFRENMGMGDPFGNLFIKFTGINTGLGKKKKTTRRKKK